MKMNKEAERTISHLTPRVFFIVRGNSTSIVYSNMI